MSRRFSDAESDGSLDLLLDTICNTFGGVVFISILVIVMVNLTNEDAMLTPPSEVSQSELVALEIRREKADEQLRRLRTAGKQRTMTERALRTAESNALADELSRQNDARRQNVQTRSQLIGEASRAQIQTNRIVRQIHERKQKLQQGRTSLAGMLQTLQTKIRDSSRQVGLPRLRQTTKAQVGFFLKGNRLYAVHRPGRHGSAWEQLRINTAEIQTIERGGTTVLEVRPGGGMPIKLDGANRSDIAKRFAQFSASNYYVKIFVWEDSFKAFASVRSVLVAKNFEYALTPMLKDQNVFVGGRSSDEVQ